MDIMVFGIIAVVVVAVVLIAVIMWMKRREQNNLKETFGTEYDQTYAGAVDSKTAKAELKARQERVASYQLKELEPEQRRAFLAEWQSMQAMFVDDPNKAISRADVLLSDVMRARGYESDLSDEDARIGDVSVGHGEEAASFREAARVAKLNRDGRATTEDLRRAIKDYGVVFDSLLNEKITA